MPNDCPKSLSTTMLPGQPIHRLLDAADRAWAAAAGQSVFGPRARWRAMLDALQRSGDCAGAASAAARATRCSRCLGHRWRRRLIGTVAPPDAQLR